MEPSSKTAEKISFDDVKKLLDKLESEQRNDFQGMG